MASKTFDRDFLIEELDLPDSAIQNTAVSSGRWMETREIIFAHEGKYYRTFYEAGLTENQEVNPWEYDEFVYAQEVALQKVTVEKWCVIRDSSDFS